tara:strand:+ start:2386 stop:6261 length:3876 start_codon:yes stop_codon:yes gene_type:complete
MAQIQLNYSDLPPELQDKESGPVGPTVRLQQQPTVAPSELTSLPLGEVIDRYKKPTDSILNPEDRPPTIPSVEDLKDDNMLDSIDATVEQQRETSERPAPPISGGKQTDADIEMQKLFRKQGRDLASLSITERKMYDDKVALQQLTDDLTAKQEEYVNKKPGSADDVDAILTAMRNDSPILAAYLTFREDIVGFTQNPDAVGTRKELEEEGKREPSGALDAMLELNWLAQKIQSGTETVVDVTQRGAQSVATSVKEKYPMLYDFLSERDDPEQDSLSITRGVFDVAKSIEMMAMGGVGTPLVGAGAATFSDIGRGARKVLGDLRETPVGRYLNEPSVLNPRRALLATIELRREAAERAAEVAGKNTGIMNDVIRGLEARMAAKLGKPVSLSKADDKGDLTLDMDKVTDVSRLNMQQIERGANEPDPDRFLDESIVPKNINGIVALYADIKKSNPNGLADVFDPKKSVIENLAGLLLRSDIDTSKIKSLTETMLKFDVDFDDIIFSTIGSASDAGRTLQQLSVIRKSFNMSGPGAFDSVQEGSEILGVGLVDIAKRLENVRRGIMVSMWKTAVRNVASVVERLPTESLGNLLDTFMWTLESKGVLKAATTLVSPRNIATSFKPFTRVMYDAKAISAYAELILNNKKNKVYWDSIANNLNEIQKSTGAGATEKLPWTRPNVIPKVIDNSLLALEEVTRVLNIPNRMQEQLMRRGIMMAELEKLVERNYGLNLIEELNKGRLDEFLQDLPSVVPDGKLPFSDLVGSAARKALQLTYSGTPDNKVAKEIVKFVTTTMPGGTGTMTVNAFPRFLANGIETVFQLTAGGTIPLVKRLLQFGERSKDARKKTGIGRWGGGGPKGSETSFVLTPKDREDISRNIVGAGVLYGMYEYFSSEDAPDDYKKIDVLGIEVDTTPFFPLRQVAWLAMFAVHLKRGTVSTWQGMEPREITETFLGSGARLSEAKNHPAVDAIVNTVTGGSGEGPMEEAEKMKRFGVAVSDYVATWLIPMGGFLEWKRAGDSTEEDTFMLNRAKDSSFGGGYSGAALAEVKRRMPLIDGNLSTSKIDNDPTVSRQIRNKDRLKKEVNEGKVVISPWYGVKEYLTPFLRSGVGILSSPRTKARRKDGSFVEPVAEFLTRYQYTEFETGSKNKNSVVRNKQNLYMSRHYPLVVEKLKQKEKVLGDLWDSGNMTNKEIFASKEQYLQDRMLFHIDTEIKNLRNNMNEIPVARWLAGARDPMVGLRIQTLQKYSSSTSASQRRAISAKFKQVNGKEPDFNSTEDLATLLSLSRNKEFMRR